LNELPEMSLGKLPVVFRLGEGALLPAAIPLPVAGFAFAVVVAPFWAMAPQATAFGSNSKTETRSRRRHRTSPFPANRCLGLVMGSLGRVDESRSGVRPVLAFWEQCLPITIVFQSESGSFPTVPGENDLEIHRKALN
jgi:hypothetical protein